MKKMIYGFLVAAFVFSVAANAYACPLHGGGDKAADKTATDKTAAEE